MVGEINAGPAPAVRPALRWSVLGLLFVWVAFWATFVVLSHANEGVALLAEGGTIVVPLVALALLSWRKPLVGGVGLCLAAAVAAWFFDNLAARMILALPALLFGLFFAWVGWRERGRA